MKKKIGILTVSVMIIITSMVLLVNKSSYALITPATNFCPSQITATKSNESLELIEGIVLPKLEVKNQKGEVLNNHQVLIYERNDNIYGLKLKKAGEMTMPIPTFSNNEEDNRYYQQLFFWWVTDLQFQEDSMLTSQEKEKIKESPSGKKVAEKVEEFVKYMTWRSAQEEEPVITLDNIDISNLSYHATNEYLETDLITPKSTREYSYIFTYYEVKVSSPLEVVDENGNEKREFERGESFRLRIPKSEIKDNKVNFAAEIIGKAKFDIWGQYILDEGTPQSTRGIAIVLYMLNCGEQEELGKFNPVYMNSNVAVGTLNIKVIDAETKENLSNAEVVIYDEDGKEVYRYKTTGEELNITLPLGNYTVKQIVTPPNYQARVVEQKVTITENSNTTATLENIQLIEVPDTGKTISNIIVIGIIIVLIGIATILMSLKRRKEAK